MISDGTRAALAGLGCNLERVRFEPDINTAIAQVMIDQLPADAGADAHTR